MLEEVLEELLKSINSFEVFKELLWGVDFAFFDRNDTIIYKKGQFESNNVQILQLLQLCKLRKTVCYMNFNDSKNFGVCAPMQKNDGQIIGYTVVYNIGDESALKFYLIIVEMIAKLLYEQKRYSTICSRAKIFVTDAEGNAFLNISNREFEIINLIAQGKTDIDIAKALHISLSTVRVYIRNIFQKLDVNNRISIINKYYRHLLTGLIMGDFTTDMQEV